MIKSEEYYVQGVLLSILWRIAPQRIHQVGRYWSYIRSLKENQVHPHTSSPNNPPIQIFPQEHPSQIPITYPINNLKKTSALNLTVNLEPKRRPLRRRNEFPGTQTRNNLIGRVLSKLPLQAEFWCMWCVTVGGSTATRSWRCTSRIPTKLLTTYLCVHAGHYSRTWMIKKVRYQNE